MLPYPYLAEMLNNSASFLRRIQPKPSTPEPGDQGCGTHEYYGDRSVADLHFK